MGSLGAFGFAMVLAVAAPAAGAESGPHPPLVSVAAARCADCHGDLVEGRTAVHAPAADDCTTCHQVEIDGGETRVTLSEAEPALCLACHGELAAAVAGELVSPHPPVADSCLTCHDPHGADRARLLLAPEVELCTGCHDRGDLEAGHGGQLAAATACTRCHQPHGSANPHLLAGGHLHPPFEGGSCDACHRPPFGERVRLRARGEKLCTACHGDVGGTAGASGGSVHAALTGEGGRAGCLSCHDPHMSPHPALLEVEGPDLCARCHDDVVAAARAQSGHPPAADDCLTCHRPHASREVRLLGEPPGELCALCHDPGDVELAGAHLGADLAALDCVACHTPHGSGNPALLATHVHPPVLDGCETCHEGAFNALAEGGGSALCALCHEDVLEAAAKAEFPHAALELGSCTDCHNPHASAQERLVKAPGAGPCADCHDEQVAGAGEVAHGVINSIGCRACHEPHGGSRPRLLRQTGSDLCLSCHDRARQRAAAGAGGVRLLDRFEVPEAQAQAIATLALSPDGQRGHPTGGHRVLGAPTAAELHRAETTFEGELSCLSCHDPHKGRSDRLLRWGAATSAEACVHCHPK